MPYGPPLYGIFLGHIFLQIWGVGVVRIIFSFGALKLAIFRRFEGIRANRSNAMKIVFCFVTRFVRIDSRELPPFTLRIAGPSKFTGGKSTRKNTVTTKKSSSEQVF